LASCAANDLNLVNNPLADAEKISDEIQPNATKYPVRPSAYIDNAIKEAKFLGSYKAGADIACHIDVDLPVLEFK
jgi:hypothetical protein